MIDHSTDLAGGGAAVLSSGHHARVDPCLALPLAVTVGSLVAVLVGSSYAASAEPYRWDAINLFNDAPAMAPGASLPPGPPPPGHASTAKVSLEMRGN